MFSRTYLLLSDVSRLRDSRLFLRLEQVRAYHKRHKIYSASDAVGLVRTNDTIGVSGFVCQGAPETLLRSLRQRFDNSGEPNDLTLLFGGGPGDFDQKGLNHLAVPRLIKRAIGSHYGQTPALAKLALDDQIEAYCVPLGSISRMYRAAASGIPGHLSKVGIGTFVDPRISGGRVNKSSSNYDVSELVKIDDQDYILYKAIPVDVAIIRATTGDSEGNLSFEKESLYSDARIIAMAARSSGGLVIAQVERIAAPESIPMRSVHVPGALVDCVVVAEKPEDNAMSFFTTYNPSWSGEIREPLESSTPWQLDVRKVIARRGALELKLDEVVNLGIGIPEGIGRVAQEEKIFHNVTLTTEGGVIGGVGSSGANFGPASGASSIQEMNQQFDFYNGGGLDACFLGMAECDRFGNVNVSRLSENVLTGPGGFIDITQCTQRVVFMGSFRKRGYEIELLKSHTNQGKLYIAKEGELSTFQTKVREITFSARTALEHGQHVQYITERAVFELCQDGLKLTEVGPGVDIDRDILAQMNFVPIVERDDIKIMDPRIFCDAKMGLEDDFFSFEKAMSHRLEYKAETHTLYLDFSGYIVTDEDQLMLGFTSLKNRLEELSNGGKNKLNVVANYDRFDIRDDLSEVWTRFSHDFAAKYYKTVARYTGRPFRRHKLSTAMGLWNVEALWTKFAGASVSSIDRAALCTGLLSVFHLKVPLEMLNRLLLGKQDLHRDDFPGFLDRLKEYVTDGEVAKSHSPNKSDSFQNHFD